MSIAKPGKSFSFFPYLPFSFLAVLYLHLSPRGTAHQNHDFFDSLDFLPCNLFCDICARGLGSVTGVGALFFPLRVYLLLCWSVVEGGNVLRYSTV